jgi:hypothetical protein
MRGSQKWFLSKSIWGSIVALLGVGLRVAGYEVSDIELQSIVDSVISVIGQVLEIGGVIMAIYGRVTATKVIR